LQSFAAEQHMILKNPLKDAGFTVLDSTSTGFMAEVQKLLDPDLLTQASPILPYSLVIKNDTGQYVWGFSVIYAYPDSIAPSGKPRRAIISPSPGGPAGRTRMLAPGATFLITPISGFLASSGDASGNLKVIPVRGKDLASLIEPFKESHGNGVQRVEASAEAVIFEDGTLIGPDEGKMMNRINDKIRARRDLIDLIGNLRGDELRAKLSLYSEHGMSDEHLTTATANSRSVVEAVANSYSLQAMIIAASLLSALRQEGESAALKQMDQIRSTKWFPDTGLVRRKQ